MNDPQSPAPQQHGQGVPQVSRPAMPQTPVPSSQSAPTTLAAAAPAQEATVRIVFFCKDCYKLVDAQKIGRKYVYRCPTCHTKNVAFGTEKSVRSFYHVEAPIAAPVPPSKPSQTTVAQ